MVRIGFITDISGLYSDIDGQGGAEAIKMAIADFGGMVNGKKIDLLVADHQNKADIASNKAREWIDQQGVDLLIGGTNSGATLAMNKVAVEKKKPIIVVSAGTARFTNEDCSPYTVHYSYDTIALSQGGRLGHRQAGRRQLVLPGRRLCLRRVAGEGRVGMSSRPTVARCWAASSIH